jgi:hypothetical protein
VEVPADVNGRGVVLDVNVSGGFRPSEVDPKNQDERFLGLWLETR